MCLHNFLVCAFTTQEYHLKYTTAWTFFNKPGATECTAGTIAVYTVDFFAKSGRLEHVEWTLVSGMIMTGQRHLLATMKWHVLHVSRDFIELAPGQILIHWCLPGMAWSHAISWISQIVDPVVNLSYLQCSLQSALTFMLNVGSSQLKGSVLVFGKTEGSCQKFVLSWKML